MAHYFDNPSLLVTPHMECIPVGFLLSTARQKGISKEFSYQLLVSMHFLEMDYFMP